MEKLILLLALFFAIPNFAQSNEIYGITRSTNPNVTYLAKVNTNTGIVEDIADASHAEYISFFGHAVDPNLGIYYLTTASFRIIGVDMNTGVIVSDQPITTSVRPNFMNFLYNESTQELIGLELGGGFNTGVYLSRINPLTGVVDPISDNPIAGYVESINYTLDVVNQWFHVISDGKIISVDVATGNIVHEPTWDNSEISIIINLQYNAADGLLYAIGRGNSQTFLVQIDPITGDVNVLSPQSLGSSVQFTGSVIDPFADVFYYVRPQPSEFVGVDMNTGLEVSTVPFDLSASEGTLFGSFYFGGITLQLALSDEDFTQEVEVSIYPNPTQNMLYVEGKSISQITLYSITGRQLANWKYDNEEAIQLNMSKYNEGIYFLKVSNAAQETKTLKFVKN